MCDETVSLDLQGRFREVLFFKQNWDVAAYARKNLKTYFFD